MFSGPRRPYKGETQSKMGPSVPYAFASSMIFSRRSWPLGPSRVLLLFFPLNWVMV